MAAAVNPSSINWRISWRPLKKRWRLRFTLSKTWWIARLASWTARTNTRYYYFTFSTEEISHLVWITLSLIINCKLSFQKAYIICRDDLVSLCPTTLSLSQLFLHSFLSQLYVCEDSKWSRSCLSQWCCLVATEVQLPLNSTVGIVSELPSVGVVGIFLSRSWPWIWKSLLNLTMISSLPQQCHQLSSQWWLRSQIRMM